MRSYYDSNQRQRSRQRGSTDRSFQSGRDMSPEIDPNRRPSYSSHQFAKKKRVKFNDQQDIKVFKKQDQPCAKSLTDDQIFQVKQRIQKQVSQLYDFNWQQKKHFDALSQQNSMKEQKQKQKELMEKLMGMKEEIQFYSPYFLSCSSFNLSMPPLGGDSFQKEAHSERIKDILGCYYTQINQIPNQPIFQVAPAQKAQPKIIKFNPGGINQSQDFVPTKTEKELKGIIKIPGQKIIRASSSRQQQQRQISPRLIWLLKDMQVNKSRYNKQMTEMILKPYKQSGQLDYLMENQDLLTQLLKKQILSTQPPPTTVNNPSNINPMIQPQIISNFPSINRLSPSPSNQFKPQFQYDLNVVQMKTQKFKTVPCKYFHSPQGCVKTQNCTFIHDERYRGIPLPYMGGNRPTNQPNYMSHGSSGPYHQPSHIESSQYSNYLTGPGQPPMPNYYLQGMNRNIYQNQQTHMMTTHNPYIQNQANRYPSYNQGKQQNPQQYGNYSQQQMNPQMGNYYGKGPSNQK